MNVAENATDTGTIALGHLNLAGGTFNAAIGTLNIGRHNRGAGGANSILVRPNAITGAADGRYLGALAAGY